MPPKQSPKGGHILTAEDGRKGGKNQKRGPSLKKRWEALLQSDIPATILKELKENEIIVGNTVLKRPLSSFAKNAGDALAMVTMAEALKREQWAVKLITEHMDGNGKLPIEHTGRDGGPITTANAELSSEAVKSIEETIFNELARNRSKE